jgi:hypothetical protein
MSIYYATIWDEETYFIESWSERLSANYLVA